MSEPLNAAKNIQVFGLKLQALVQFREPEFLRPTFRDLQKALGLNKTSAEKAITCLTQMGYLSKPAPTPGRYVVDGCVVRVCAERNDRPLKREYGLDFLRQLIEQLARHQSDNQNCWVSEVRTFGAIFDASIVEPLIEVQVIVDVVSATGAALGMRSIEKRLRRTDKCLKPSLILNLL